jgi:hypothetical protein
LHTPAFIVMAAVVTGPWALNFIYRDGTHTQGYCTLVQRGTVLSGACGPDMAGGAPISGSIVDNEVIWQVDGGPSYRATLDERGTFMRGAFSSTGGEGVFTAMRMNPK